LGPLLFLLYTNDLPKIINKTSTPVMFADDTSILFAQSNLTDLNKNVHNVFETLNKWFGANQLSLNFKKTHDIHFATKRNTSTDFKISYNNSFITSISCTKFLGVTMDKTLSWNNHTELLIKKLAEMPGIARAGLRTPLASIIPSLTLSLSARIHGRIDKRTDHKSHHLLIVIAKHQPQNGLKENSTCFLSLPINSHRKDQKNTTVAQQRILRSDKHHISLATGPQNGPQRKDHPIVVHLPSNRSRHPIFPKM
jgi:hypothetical protein